MTMREYRYEFLLAGLLVFLAAIPISQQFLGEAGGFGVRFGFVALLLLGVASLRPARPWFVAGLGLVAVSVACNLAALLWPTAVPIVAARTTSFAFVVLVILVALPDVLVRGRADIHKLVGMHLSSRKEAREAAET